LLRHARRGTPRGRTLETKRRSHHAATRRHTSRLQSVLRLSATPVRTCHGGELPNDVGEMRREGLTGVCQAEMPPHLASRHHKGGLRSPSQSLLATQHDAGVLARPLSSNTEAPWPRTEASGVADAMIEAVMPASRQVTLACISARYLCASAIGLQDGNASGQQTLRSARRSPATPQRPR
jgi:hypothetical protein